MKKAAFALILICLNQPAHADSLQGRLATWSNENPGLAAALLLAGTAGTAIACAKGFKLARFHYLALNSLRTLNKRAQSCIQAVEVSLGDELPILESMAAQTIAENKRTHQKNLLAALRSKFEQKSYPLLYCHQLVKIMHTDVEENRDLLNKKLRGDNDDHNEVIKAEEQRDRLSTLADELDKLKTFLENTYEFKAEYENRCSKELQRCPHVCVE